eukprot:6202285-Pleurochrysis_carterae.AAC.1
MAAEGPKQSGEPIRAQDPRCSMSGTRTASKLRGGMSRPGLQHATKSDTHVHPELLRNHLPKDQGIISRALRRQ